MASDHYSNLGVSVGASQDEIRTAYRKMARQFHPDRNPSEEAQERFLSIKESYETLSNGDRKEIYDRYRGYAAKAKAKAETSEPKVKVSSGERVQTASYFKDRVAWEQDGKRQPDRDEFLRARRKIEEMQKMAARGRWGEAAGFADEIIRAGVNEPLAYAVLADAARLKGDYVEAAKQYGYAVQFDPDNTVYQDMHVAMMETGKRKKVQVARDPGENNLSAFVLGMVGVVAAICYTAVAKEVPIAPDFGPISTWTLGQVVTMLVSGVAMGASLSASDLLDHFDLGGGTAGYRVHPGFMVAFVSLINFWLAFGIYVLVGVTQKSFHVSVTRLVSFVAVGVLGFGFARFGLGWDAVSQTIIWAGSILYLAGLIGWFVADSLRRV
ncbi:MAG: DnaJ domain-containing protein [Fimbriimonadaceae bacterium]